MKPSISLRRTFKQALSRDVSKPVFKGMQSLWRQAIGDFAVAAAREVAVKTGQSRAALIPLAEVGGQGQVLASEIIGEKARGPYTNKEEIEDVRLAGFSNNLGINRSVETGRNLGQGASKIGFGTQHTPRMSLKWAIPVYQYSLHEGRWQSLPQGRQALTESISRNFDSHISVNQMKRQLLRYLRTR